MTDFPTEMFAANQKAYVDMLYRLANEGFHGVEQITALNLKATRSLISNQAQWALNAVSGAAPQSVFQPVAGTPPFAERLANYNRELFQILASTQAAIAQQATAHYEKQVQQMQTGIDQAARSAPAGSEAAVAALKTAISATNTLYDSLYKTARQAVEAAESNFSAVTGEVKRTQATAARNGADTRK
jgi:phasin family protein